MFRRNVLVQPGPLSVSHADRSLDKLSYRIIDFGRGIGLGVNIFSLQDLKREVESEHRDARAGRLIPSSSTSSSSKRKLSQLDLSAQSSSSIKRSKPSEDASALSRFVDVAHNFKQVVSTFFQQRSAPVPASTLLTLAQLEAQVNAIQQLLESIPSSSSASSPKRKVPSFDLSAQSTSSKKISRQTPGTKALDQLFGAISTLSSITSQSQLSTPVAVAVAAATPAPLLAPAPAPPPAPPPVPGALSQAQVKAIHRLLDYEEISQKSGDVWLSDEEVKMVGDVFRQDCSIAEVYLIFSRNGDSPRVREWVKDLL